MIPWSNVLTLPSSLTVTEVIHQLPELSYSRIPVYEDDPNDPQGSLYLKDLIPWIGHDSPPPLASLLRPLHFVPLDVSISAVLDTFLKRKWMGFYGVLNPKKKKMAPGDESDHPPIINPPSDQLRPRKTTGHLFLVVDRQGVNCGIITLQDILDHVVKGLPPPVKTAQVTLDKEPSKGDEL